MKRFMRTLLLCSAMPILGAASHTSQTDGNKNVGTCCTFLQERCPTNWYLGAGISFADLFYFDHREDNTFVGTRFAVNDHESESTVSAPSLGYNVFLGYEFNDFIDIEVKFAQIARPFKNNSFTDVSSIVEDDTIFETTKLYLLSFGPYLLINLPIYTVFTPFFRFGMVTNLVTFKEAGHSDERFTSDSGAAKSHLWVERLNVGMGFKSNWWDMVSFQIEYETPISNSIVGETNTSTGLDFYVPGIISASFLVEF